MLVSKNEKTTYRVAAPVENKIIKSLNENDGALQVLLAASLGNENIKINIRPVVDQPGRRTFMMLESLATAYTRSPKVKTDVNFLLKQVPEVSKKETFFNKFAEVFRSKGTPMELYEEPAALDLLEKIPSFTDSAPSNEAVKFLDNFERSKSVIIAQDKVDKQFLRHVEKMIMTWASVEGDDKKSLSESLAKNVEIEGLMKKIN